MIAAVKCTLIAGIGCILAAMIAGRHQPVAASHPTDTPPPMQRLSMQPDQINEAGWDKAWTNLLNVAEQSFTPSLPKLLGVEVELVVGNPGRPEDELTLTIVDANGKELAVVTQKVQTANPEHVMFLMPTDGV